MAEQTSRTRASRESDKANVNRALTERPKKWQPASLLPEPKPRPGLAHRWIRKSILGRDDPTNFSRKLREGWETCKLEDYEELKMAVDTDAHSSGLVEIGGMILCAMPAELVGERNAYFRQMTQAQMQSVDNNMMREQDPRLPTLFKERQTKVSFGRGE